MDSHEFSAVGVSAASVAAQEYFVDKYPASKEFIYSLPKPEGLDYCAGPRMTQINYGKARGVQISGNASGTTIITGDSVMGGFHVGDKIELS